MDKISNVIIVHGSPNKDRMEGLNYIPDNEKEWLGWIKKTIG